MNDSHWNMFADLIHRIVHDVGLPTWQDHRDVIRQKMAELNADSDFEEFVSWFSE